MSAAARKGEGVGWGGVGERGRAEGARSGGRRQPQRPRHRAASPPRARGGRNAASAPQSRCAHSRKERLMNAEHALHSARDQVHSIVIRALLGCADDFGGLSHITIAHRGGQLAHRH